MKPEQRKLNEDPAIKRIEEAERKRRKTEEMDYRLAVALHVKKKLNVNEDLHVKVPEQESERSNRMNVSETS